MKTKHWTITLGLMLILSLSACGQKEETAKNPNPETPTKTETTTTTTDKTNKTDEKKAEGLKPEKNGVDCPKDAPIKALTTKKRGKIYHDKKYPDYKKAKPETCFKDVASAEKAGYKKP
jgi:uncharacterized lipoprotein YehR (DUF1307 family)